MPTAPMRRNAISRATAEKFRSRVVPLRRLSPVRPRPDKAALARPRFAPAPDPLVSFLPAKSSLQPSPDPELTQDRLRSRCLPRLAERPEQHRHRKPRSLILGTYRPRPERARASYLLLSRQSHSTRVL